MLEISLPGDSGQRPTPEVLGGEHHDRLILGYTLDIIAPAASQLDARLARFHARIHGQHLVEAQQFGEILLEFSEHVIVESTRGERQNARLFSHLFDYFRVTVALIHGAVCRQKVVILVAFYVPHENALGFLDGHRQRVIIVGAVLVLTLEDLLGLFSNLVRGVFFFGSGGR